MSSAALSRRLGPSHRFNCKTSLLGSVRRFQTVPQTGSMVRAGGQLRTLTRRTAYVTVVCGTIYVVDNTLNASALTRSLRTLWTCAMITLDYKLNFTPEKSHLIPELHERVANRLYNLFTSNGGLYIKIGQAIGANAALLPLPMQAKFARLFDDAPQISTAEIHSVFLSEFGRPPSGRNGVFEEFDERAVASASIAQVHRARLWPKDADKDDAERWVAVKVQKKDVGRQVEWDLGVYKAVMWMFEHWAFDLPVYFVCEFVSDHLRRELDFEQEAYNALQTSKFVASEPRLASRVYVPKVYPALSTKKIMTAEFISGVALSDRPAIRRLMGVDPSSPSSPPPLTGGLRSVMETMVSLFSAQIFSFGWVHCDPHPGNIIIRPNPRKPTEAQLVLLDHGLYVGLTDEFKRQYALLWRGLLTVDWEAIEGVAREWGIGTPDLFASATLMRPVKRANRNGNGEDWEELSEYERSVRMKAKLKGFLTDTDKMPKELIFLGRNMRMVQGNNQSLSSPVNRIKITGLWASRSLTTSPSLTFTERLREYYRYIVFRTVLFSLDIAFWVTRTRQWIRARLGGGKEGEGFEDELERTMRGFAKSSFGVEVAPEVFQG